MNACNLPQYIKLYLNIHRILDIVILLTSGLTGLVDFMNPRRKSFNHSHLSCSLPLSLWLPLRLCVSSPPSHWRSHSSTVIISSPAPLCWSLSWSSSRLASAVSSKKGIQFIPLLTFHLITFPLLRSLINLINSLHIDSTWPNPLSLFSRVPGGCVIGKMLHLLLHSWRR